MAGLMSSSSPKMVANTPPEGIDDHDLCSRFFAAINVITAVAPIISRRAPQRRIEIMIELTGLKAIKRPITTAITPQRSDAREGRFTFIVLLLLRFLV